MRVAHVHETALGNAGAPACAVCEHEQSREDSVSQVELLAVVLDLRLLQVEPIAVLDAEPEMQPVGAVDQVLVDDVAPCDLGDETVVEPGDVGRRVVRAAGYRLGGGATGCEVAVSEGAERLPQRLLAGIEVLVDERPAVHWARDAARSARKVATWSVSSRMYLAWDGSPSPPTTMPRPRLCTTRNASSSVVSSPR